MAKQWFSSGFDSDAIKERPKADFTTYGPDRFWMPAGASRELVFVDSNPVTIKEHGYKQGGSWNNHLTCIQPLLDDGEKAVCCSALDKEPSSVTFLTMVDASKWTDKKGNVRQYELKLFPAKYHTAAKLMRKNASFVAEGQTIAAKLWNVVRETDKSPSVGDDFEVKRSVDLAKLFAVVTYKGKKLSDLFDAADNSAEEYGKLARVFQVTKGADGRLIREVPAFNYEHILAPKTTQEIKEILKGYSAEDNDSPKGQSRAEDVPF